MSALEFSRIIRLKSIQSDPQNFTASTEECAALAERFEIEGIANLRTEVKFELAGTKVLVSGLLMADVVQACAISGEVFPHRISEALGFVFVPAEQTANEELEIELRSGDLDEIEYDGDSFDLGEAIAQSLGLAIDPYAEGPNADAARKAAGITSDDAPIGQLAEALKELKRTN